MVKSSVSNYHVISIFKPQIHHEMAKYHELGRFSLAQTDNIDYVAALFHEEHAAELGILEAQLTLARLYLGMQREVLVNYTVQVSRISLFIRYSAKSTLKFSLILKKVINLYSCVQNLVYKFGILAY